jgi:hypothetical protein
MLLYLLKNQENVIGKRITPPAATTIIDLLRKIIINKMGTKRSDTYQLP